MTHDEIRNMIDLYFDNELDKTIEPELFTTLSTDNDAREYFKKLNILQTVIAGSIEPFPVSLEENIFTSIKTVNKRSLRNVNLAGKASHFISIAAAAILLIICSLLFFELKNYKTKIDSISEQVKEQKETIDIMLNNNYPAIVVSPETKNEIIVRATFRRKI